MLFRSVFPNLLRDVQPDGPNQVWVADLTYLRLEREFAYLAVILDAWSRKVVGYAVGHVLDARLPLAALEAALESRRPPPGLLHHSDRGVQYASRRYRERLAEAGLRGSMSRTGNPYDNARVESFMKTLKHEEVYLHDYATVQDAIDRLPYFLEEVYNRKRLHSSLGYRPRRSTRPNMRRRPRRSMPTDPPVQLQGVTPLQILCNLKSAMTGRPRPIVTTVIPRLPT